MHRGTQGLTEDMLRAEYDAVYHYVLSVCRSEQIAQEITQETFFKAIKAYDRFKGESSLYTWLCSIAKNVWLNYCKKNNCQTFSELDQQQEASELVGVEQMLINQDYAKRIHIVLHKLEEPYKEVFSLRVFGELPFSQIAELFSKTDSWARVTYYRAKKMILEKLEKDGWL